MTSVFRPTRLLLPLFLIAAGINSAGAQTPFDEARKSWHDCLMPFAKHMADTTKEDANTIAHGAFSFCKQREQALNVDTNKRTFEGRMGAIIIEEMRKDLAGKVIVQVLTSRSPYPTNK